MVTVLGMTPETLSAIWLLIGAVKGTPYILGGNSPAGTDCSGLAAWVSNIAVGRPPYSERFSTANQRQELIERGFLPGTAPGALVIGWNGGHTAVTLPDGTSVSSGEGGGVQLGGAGAYQSQFTNHMYLPMAPQRDLVIIDAPPVHAPAPELPLPPAPAPAPI